MRRPTSRLWVVMVIIAVVALAAATMVMRQRSREHLRWARFYDQQKREAIRRVDLEAEGTAHCREGLARTRKRSDGDPDLKAWLDQLPSGWRKTGGGDPSDEAVKIWTELLAFWESEAEVNRERVATWERLRLIHSRAASHPWEVGALIIELPETFRTELACSPFLGPVIMGITCSLIP